MYNREMIYLDMWIHIFRVLLGFLVPMVVMLFALRRHFTPLVWLRKLRFPYVAVMWCLLGFETLYHFNPIYYPFLMALVWFAAYPGALFILRAVCLAKRFDGTFRQAS